MLSRIYVDNFRSFVNFEYRPEPKQLWLGPNGSGKSSLFDAIRYIQQFVQGDSNPFTQSTRTRWEDRPLQVVEVDALVDGLKYEYRVEIRFEGGNQTAVRQSGDSASRRCSCFRVGPGSDTIFSG
jgi:DNA repair exonuclease SbcCD ATPase subunit